MNSQTETTYLPETLSSLSAKYKVSTRTMKLWLEDMEPQIKIKHKMTFSPKELKRIYDYLGDYNTN